MDVQPGQSLLHYRLVEKIGEGGMGVVWKAVDTTLDRPVAIKILPPTLAADTARLARFEREAKLLASLNHPNIATIHGLHEADGIRFLAMELIDGEDLAAALARGPLGIDETVRIATRVAEALETAHDNGIVHRDLKPANVALTADGSVKVLDFGLAKALEPERASSGDPSLSPTMTSAPTAAGIILGTAGYMSPEQSRGHEVDARADVWALGCLIYEMLTGRRAHDGKTVSDTLAAVLRGEPEWEALPPDTPAGLVRLMHRCLVKDARDRLRHAGDVRLDLADLSGEEAHAAKTARAPRGRLVLPLVIVSVLALALAVWGWMRPRPAARGGVPARFEIVGATGDEIVVYSSLAVSPDGRRVAWVVARGTTHSLRLRELDSLETRDLPDTEGAYDPTFSPDGRSIAFYAHGKVRRLDIGDRTAIDLCDAVEGAGISWSRDGTIVFNAAWIAGLSRVSAEGGTPETATQLDPEDGEIGHWFPDVLPDGEHVLVTRWRTGLEDTTVGVASLASGETRDLVPRASYARYVPPGYLLFARGGALYTVPFDAAGLRVTGKPRAIVDDVDQSWSSGSSPFDVSDTGVLIYQTGGLWSTRRPVVRVSRDGTEQALDVEPGAYLSVAISPDGKKLALTEFQNGRTNVLIRDLERGVDKRLPLDAVNAYPVWGPDSRQIAFTTARYGPWDIFRVPIDGGSAPEELVRGVPDQIALDWSRDGRYLVFQEAYETTRLLDLSEGAAPRTVPQPVGIHHDNGLRLSPDSRWLAFGSAVSGQREVFVQRFPDGTRAFQVSIGGGSYPLWSRDGTELFYRRGDAVFVVAIRPEGDEIVPGRPRELFRGDFVNGDELLEWSYDPTTDSLILLGQGEHEPSPDRFIVDLDWLAALE